MTEIGEKMHPRYNAIYTTPSGRELACEYRGMTPGGMARIWFPDGSSMTTWAVSVRVIG